MKKVALRIDDIGASSKEYEVYSKKWFGLGNLLFLKRMQYFKAWGPYREMSANDWSGVLKILENHDAKLTVGITATWVNYDGSRIPFNKKYPQQAHVLKAGVESGLVEIANHGLTHCVLQDNLFRPRLFKSNRSYHREFWPWLGSDLHHRHMRESQDILQNYFGVNVVTLIPPGNVFTCDTIDAARRCGILNINCQTSDRKEDGVRIISNKNVVAFHDKEIVTSGLDWLAGKIEDNCENQFVFVRDLY